MSATLEVPQWRVNLEKANRVYRGHAALKREIRAGDLSVTTALADPRATGSLTIGRLVASQNRWGPHKTGRFLGRLGISPVRRVDALTDRQRRLIEEAL